MNKKKIAAITAAILAFGASAAIAKDSTEVITAVYRNIQLIVDGNNITPKDADGNVVEPFIYDGTTYLPVRAVANAFNKQVDWDGDNAYVFLGGKVSKPKKQLNLWSRSYTACSNPNRTKSFEEKSSGYISYEPEYNGEEIVSDRYFRTDYITYPINSLAKYISGEFYVSNSYGAESQEGVLKICNSNDKVLWTSPIMRKSTDPVSFKVNVENEIEVKLVFESTSSGSHNKLYIKNPMIVSADY